MNVESAASLTSFEQVRCSSKCHSEITQIYEELQQQSAATALPDIDLGGLP